MGKKRSAPNRKKDKPVQLYNYLYTLTLKLNSVVETDHRSGALNEKHGVSLCCVDEERAFYNSPPTTCTKFTSIRILHNKLLNQRWGDVVVLLLGLMKVNWKEHLFTPQKKLEDTVWRVGMETLLQHPQCVLNHKDHLSTFKRVLGSYHNRIDQLHLLLEYSFNLMCQNDFAAAKKSLEKYDSIDRSMAGTGKTERAKRIVQWTPIMEAYLGLLDYVLWKLCVSHTNITQTTSLEDSSYEHAQMATDALKHLKNIIDKPGTWDIFVSKQVEMLSFYSMWDEAKEVLCSYSASHPDNPNAHKYLFQFANAHCDKDSSWEDLKLTTLQNLYKVAPSDLLCLQLHDLYLEKWLQKKPKDTSNKLDPSSDLYLALDVIFTMLSYAVWQNDIRPWKRLETVLECMFGTKNANPFQLIKRFLVETERDNWWPRLLIGHYFCSSEVLVIKNHIATICSFE